MFLKHLALQNFRNYSKAVFELDPETLIVGPNTSGKTNILEAIYLLSTGKSLKTDKDTQMVKFGEEIGRVKGRIGDTDLEVVLTKGEVGGEKAQTKKFLVNNVSKRRVDFVGNLPVVSFSPLDLEIIIGSPSQRREFMDEVLEQTDFDYRISINEYTKGIRQRNSLLELSRKLGHRDIRQFEYWDNLVIKHGNVVTEKREALIADFNNRVKEIFDFMIVYDKSAISYERLSEYYEEEYLAGVTLVGPHRDDLIFEMIDKDTQTARDIKFFGSRGQQRLAILQLKLLELQFLEEKKEASPLLLLDDIFSELDGQHIKLVLDILKGKETVFTTTHLEFVPEELASKMKVITLTKR